MIKKNKILILNWKMQPSSLESALKKAKEISSLSKRYKIEIYLASPAIYALEIKKKFKNIKVGLQNIYFEKSGAFTGEISPLMISKNKLDFALIGHSERRVYFKENYKVFLKKIKACQSSKVKVIFCFESLKEIKKIKNKKGIIFAYEPRKYISSFGGKIIEKEKLKKIVENFRKILPQEKILYGGSLSPENVKELNFVDGFLIGIKSINPKFVRKIIENLN